MSVSQAVLTQPIAANYLAFTTATTVTAYAGQGVFFGFYGITAGTTWAITIYDNTAASGNVLAAFTNTANTFFGPAGSLTLMGVIFKTGLTITATGTPGAGNLLYQLFQ